MTPIYMKERKKNKSQILLVSPDFPPPFIGGSLVYIHNLITHSNLKFDILTNRINRKNDFNSTFWTHNGNFSAGPCEIQISS